MFLCDDLAALLKHLHRAHKGITDLALHDEQ
jgi:hypothetical protein